MWDRWKNKIQNFIWKEVETENETEEDSNESKIDQHHDKNQPIQTKMVYQYPDKKPFKFPIIPDEPPEKKWPTPPPISEERLRETIVNSIKMNLNHMKNQIKSQRILNINLRGKFIKKMKVVHLNRVELLLQFMGTKKDVKIKKFMRCLLI